VALWHERDISHSSAERIVLPDSCALIDYMLRLCTRVVTQVRVNPGKMLEDVETLGRITCSPRVLDALIVAGRSREDAYREVQALAERARRGEAGFEALVRAELGAALPTEALDRCFDLQTYLVGIDDTYRRLGLEIRDASPEAAAEERPKLALEAGIGGGLA
jgi:adenylosuccinate lyase